ncbi:MAG: hypothetical protein DI586_05450 [Micavibrio aeruginosavorus]|uniref:Uncharacterized protein n=1 Tax=Micavibrio aeruginosavorus TaxID=349221 RepID=A0A2W5FQ17_9BACT|nr:MAG: hypothetical protein DI586_05450 [Micavibrio aeruginosavorus]
MGKAPTNLLPQSFKQAAEQKSDVGVLKPLQFVEHKGEPGAVFRTSIRDAKGEVHAANTFMTDAQMKNSIDKLMTDHLKHDHLDKNVATLREARADLKGIVNSGIDLPNATAADISRMSPLDSLKISSPELPNHGIKSDVIGNIIKNSDEFGQAAKAAEKTAIAVKTELEGSTYISPREGAEIAGDTSRISTKLSLNLAP